jgi:hypothetical protein
VARGFPGTKESKMDYGQVKEQELKGILLKLGNIKRKKFAELTREVAKSKGSNILTIDEINKILCTIQE